MSGDLTISGIHHKKVKVEVIAADVSASIVASGQLTVPPPKPDIASILDTPVSYTHLAGKPPVQKILNVVSTEIITDEVRIIPDLVIIQGRVRTQVIYVAAEPDQPVHHMHLEVRCV